MRKQQHVVPRPQGWAVRGAGKTKDTVVVDTQKEALKIAREIAINQRAEVVTHDRSGRIRDLDSYGNDPSRIKDTKY